MKHSKLEIQNPEFPFVLVSMAMTADGKIATANRAVHTFGSRRDLQNLYALRATADAILCGARTVEVSGATLGNGGEQFRRRRVKAGLAGFPLRVVVSGGGTLDPAANIFSKRFSPIIILAARRAAEKNLRRIRPLADGLKIFGGEGVDLRAALRWLRSEFGVRRLVCEGGGELNAALFRAGLVDEIHLTVCPKIFGGRSAPTIADGVGFQRLADAARFELKSARRVGGEMFLVFGRSTVASRPSGRKARGGRKGG